MSERRKRPTIAFMDDATGNIIHYTTRAELGSAKWAIQVGALVRIAGRFWQIVRICPALCRHCWRMDVQEVAREDLLDRPFCPNGLWSLPGE